MVSLPERTFRTLLFLVPARLRLAAPRPADRRDQRQGRRRPTARCFPASTVEARSEVLPGAARDGDRRQRGLPAAGAAARQLHAEVRALGHAERRRARRRCSWRRTPSPNARSGPGSRRRSTVVAESSLIDKDVGHDRERHHQQRDRRAAGRPGVPRPAEADPRRAVQPGPGARPERRRQRPGQRLPVRRRQRHAAALRHALGRARLARHRRRSRSSRAARDAVDFDRAGGFSIDSVSKSGTSQFHGQLSFQFQGNAMAADLDTRQPVALRGGPHLDDGQPRRPDPAGEALLLRLVLPADARRGRTARTSTASCPTTRAPATRASAS